MTDEPRKICKWCGVFEADHGYDVLATQCYPAQVEKLRTALETYLAAKPQCECTEHSGCGMAAARAQARATLIGSV